MSCHVQSRQLLLRSPTIAAMKTKHLSSSRLKLTPFKPHENVSTQLKPNCVSFSHYFPHSQNSPHGSLLTGAHFDLFYCTLSVTYNVTICHRGHCGFLLVTLQRDPSIPLGEASIGPLFSWKPSNHLPPRASGAACHRSLEKHSRCIHLPSIRGWTSTISS